ncbi:MAG: potassium channel family protein [Leifsonia sp.]
MRGGWRSGYWLVLILIVISYAVCATQKTPDPSAFALFIQLATVAVILRVAEQKKVVRRAGWIVLAAAALALVTVWLAGGSGRLLDILFSGASMVLYLIALIAIIAQQAKKDHIDGQTLLAAVAAYVLIGMAFTFAYNFIALATSAPVFGPGTVNSLDDQLFFSFSTLTTTGYGNLVPVGAAAQSAAIGEAITGQLFLVIAVARVVSGWRAWAD